MALAVNAMAAGAAISVALFAVVTWGTLQLTRLSGVTDISEVAPTSAATNFIAFGTVAALFGTMALTWLLLRPVRSPYRRWGIAMVATLGGAVLSLVATLAARWLLASGGLLVLLVLALLVTRVFVRRTRAATAALPSAHRSR